MKSDDIFLDYCDIDKLISHNIENSNNSLSIYDVIHSYILSITT